MFSLPRCTLSRAMRKACDELGIKRFSPHKLRHRRGSRDVYDGVPIPKVADLLGHSRKSFTWDTYVHVLPPDESVVRSR